MACKNCECGTTKAPTLKFFKTHPDVPSPAYGTDQAACFDLAYCAAGKEYVTAWRHGVKHEFYLNDGKDLVLLPGYIYMLPTGLIFDVPEGFSLRVHPRSSTGLKYGLIQPNSEGVIDADYTQESFLLFTAVVDVGMTVRIPHLTRLAQAELVPMVRPLLIDTNIAPSQKGNRVGGFGSTGA